MNELRERKNRIRDEYRALRSSIEPSVKKDYDARICQRFMSLASYRFADVLFLYSPLKTEIDVLPIAEDALKRGKIVTFPRCNEDENTMTYYVVTDLSQLERGAFGIMEPNANLPVFNPEVHEGSNMICFVPALVFDKSGYRLGYGKGYYDRYLCDFHGAKVGVQYHSCVVDSLPRGRFDTAVDFLVTEKGVITINANQT